MSDPSSSTVRPDGKKLYEDAISGPEFDEVKARFKHLRNRFGWQHLVETTYYRERALAEGCDPFGIQYEVSRRYVAAHANDMNLRERHAFFGVGRHRVAASPDAFTAEDLAFLIEHFEDANDPQAAAILAKATDQLAWSIRRMGAE